MLWEEKRRYQSHNDFSVV